MMRPLLFLAAAAFVPLAACVTLEDDVSWERVDFYGETGALITSWGPDSNETQVDDASLAVVWNEGAPWAYTNLVANATSVKQQNLTLLPAPDVQWSPTSDVRIGEDVSVWWGETPAWPAEVEGIDVHLAATTFPLTNSSGARAVTVPTLTDPDIVASTAWTLKVGNASSIRVQTAIGQPISVAHECTDARLPTTVSWPAIARLCVSPSSPVFSSLDQLFQLQNKTQLDAMAAANASALLEVWSGYETQSAPLLATWKQALGEASTRTSKHNTAPPEALAREVVAHDDATVDALADRFGALVRADEGPSNDARVQTATLAMGSTAAALLPGVLLAGVWGKIWLGRMRQWGGFSSGFKFPSPEVFAIIVALLVVVVATAVALAVGLPDALRGLYRL